MVADYLWWAGWRHIEIVELCDGVVRADDEEQGMMKGGLGELMRGMGMGAGRVDPLWVVRGVKVEKEEEGGAK